MLKFTFSSVVAVALVAAALSIESNHAPAVAAPSKVAAGPSVIKFTAIPDNNESTLRQRMQPFADYLTEKMGVKFEYLHVVDYASAVKAMEKEDAHLGWFGGFTGVQVRQRVKGSRAIAQGEEDKAFYSYFIAHKSTGLKESAEFPKGIEKKTFTFGSESSTSGRLMPESFIRAAFGKKPDEVFAKVGFSGAHDKTIALVAAGTWEVGAVNGVDWEKAVKAEKQGDAVMIWKTPTYMDYNWTIRGNIDEVYGAGFGEKLQKAILAIDPKNGERDQKVMEAFARKRFIEAKNEDYATLAQVAKDIGLLR